MSPGTTGDYEGTQEVNAPAGGIAETLQTVKRLVEAGPAPSPGR